MIKLVSYHALLLLGAPGSGKGTQGKILSSVPGFFHCACGDVFRSVDESSEAGQAFKKFSDQGQLVPDDVTIKLWATHLDAMISKGKFKSSQDYLVLDGIPRTVAQAEILAPYLKIHRVFHLDCRNREELIKRLRNRALKENRVDDASVEVIQHRLQVYDQLTKPLLDYYGPKLTTEIDSSQAPHIVLRDILSVVPAMSAS